MRVLVVDDEPLARSRLGRLLDGIVGVEVLGEASDGVEALESIQRLDPDLVLLDVRMPRMDGLELARHLATLETPPAVVFTTAYDEYALAAFDAQAVAYLLKPVRADRLEAALARAARPTRAQMESLPGRAPRKNLSARVGDRLELLPVTAVKYFIADQKYVTAVHAGGEMLLDETLKELEHEFGERFLRIHRSTLVATDCIERLESLEGGGGLVHLRGGSATLEVSRRHLGSARRSLRGT